MNIRTWKAYYFAHGIDPQIIPLYLPYIKRLLSQNLPVIFEFEHLSRLLGINRTDLAKMVNAPDSYYRIFSIPKRRGGFRTIASPYPSLLHCQKWICENILQKQELDSSCHGFAPGRSIITNAKEHLQKKAILKIDIKDFFPSIPINWIIQFFKRLGYAPNVAYHLSSLCCFEGALGQGAATSPSLSNILCKNLDIRLRKLSKLFHLTYTRYADDLVFSGAYISLDFKRFVEGIIEEFGFTINKDKTVLNHSLKKKIITGLSVSGSTVSVPKRYHRDLKQIVFYIRRFGLSSHMKKIKSKNPLYLETIIGRVSFVLQVEPENTWAQEAKQFLVSLLKSCTD